MMVSMATWLKGVLEVDYNSLCGLMDKAPASQVFSKTITLTSLANMSDFDQLFVAYATSFAYNVHRHQHPEDA
jgi:hypothetical protein